jgi:tetratricopeptide (TPR) repeat protein
MLIPAAAVLIAGCGPNTQPMVDEAAGLYQAGHLDRAKARFEQVLDVDPTHPDAHYYLGRIYHNERFYEQAIFYYQACLDTDPSYPLAADFLDQAQRQAGRTGPKLRIIPDVRGEG